MQTTSCGQWLWLGTAPFKALSSTDDRKHPDETLQASLAPEHPGCPSGVPPTQNRENCSITPRLRVFSLEWEQAQKKGSCRPSQWHVRSALPCTSGHHPGAPGAPSHPRTTQTPQPRAHLQDDSEPIYIIRRHTPPMNHGKEGRRVTIEGSKVKAMGMIMRERLRQAGPSCTHLGSLGDGWKLSAPSTLAESSSGSQELQAASSSSLACSPAPAPGSQAMGQ